MIFQIFPHFPIFKVEKFNTDKLQKLIIEHLVLLKEKVNHYFPSLTTNVDWVFLLFYFADNIKELDLNNDEKNEFIELCSNSIKKIIFNSQKKFLAFFLSKFR